MKVIVFGSTGGTGMATMRALVAAGHDVTAFARDPTKLPSSPAIRPVRGDVMNAAEVAVAVPGHDLAIVSLGNSQNPFAMMLGARRTTPANVCEAGTRHIVAAMQAAGMARLLVVSAFGIGDTKARLPFAFKLFYRTVLREHMADKEKQEELVKSSGLDPGSTRRADGWAAHQRLAGQHQRCDPETANEPRGCGRISRVAGRKHGVFPRHRRSIGMSGSHTSCRNRTRG
jgi:nucleoside-diphosphate-sugar epimerase